MTWQHIDWSNPLNRWFIVLVETLPLLECDSVSRLGFSIRCHGLLHMAFGDFIHEPFKMP